MLNMQNPFKLLEEIKQLLTALLERKNYKSDQANPHQVIEKIFHKGIKWFDYSELSTDRQRKYFNECQATLNSEANNNIKNYLIATWTQEAVKDFDPNNGLSVRDVQMSINGLEKYFEELQAIPNPDDPSKKVLKENNPKRFEAT